MFNSTNPTSDYRNYDGGLTVGGLAGVASAYLGTQASQFLGLGASKANLQGLLLNTPEYFAWASSQPLMAAAFWTIPTIAGLAAGCYTFTKMAAPRPPYDHVSGTRFWKDTAAIEQAKIASRALQNQAGKDGIEILPKVILPVKNVLQSIMCVGGQGTGKTTIINHLLKKLIARQDHKLLIFDPVKGDFTRWIPEVNAMLSITDCRASHWWLGYDIVTEDDAQEFADGMIATTGDAFWAKSARAVLVACLIKLQSERGQDWSWQQLNELVFSDLETLNEAAATYYPPAQRLLTEGSRTTDSILINLNTDLLPIRRISEAMDRINGKKISMKKWMASNKPGKVLVQMDQEVGTAAAAMSRALINVLATQVASIKFPERSKLHCGFIMDEIPQFGRLESVAKLMEIGRSKGIYTIFGFQDWAQVDQIYPRGEADKWDALFGLKIITGVKSEVSKNRVTGMLGDQIVRYTTTSMSGSGSGNSNKTLSRSLPTARKPVSPQELGNFGLRKGGVEALFIGLGKDALAIKIDFPDCPAIRPPFKPHAPAIQFTSLAALQSEIDNKPMLGADPELIPATALPSLEAPEVVEISEADVDQIQMLEILDIPTEPSQPPRDEENLLGEVQDEVAKNVGSELLEGLTGLDSHIFEAASELLDLDTGDSSTGVIIEQQPHQTTTKKRRSRKIAPEAEA